MASVEFDSPTREVEFALDRFASEDGRLVVEGRWYGVLGRRFVRPVLLLEGRRRLIAVMEHKPWNAVEGGSWIAAFDHPGGRPGRARLQVAPDVAVDLPAPGPRAGDGERLPARVARPTIRRFVRAEEIVEESPVELVAVEEPATERAALTDEPPVLWPAPDAARGEAASLRSDLEAARNALAARDSELEAARAESERLAAEADRTRARLDAVDSEHAAARTTIAQLQEDVRRLQTAADQALAERNAARDELERARVNAGRQPYIAPRPMPFRDTQPRPDWRLRVAAGVLTVLLLVLLVGVLSAIF